MQMAKSRCLLFDHRVLAIHLNHDLCAGRLKVLGFMYVEYMYSARIYCILAVITRPPDGVLLAPSALAARRLRRLASLLEL